ncbi:hypothetical protein [Nitrosococcus watsonii]|uniref:Exosortase system-associated protein, TIGR04073 family n=1 Tax=Nitrosococcus watsoni (strain C-113) TaxID=105559 RepID=D8KCB2_NITWC|nr:hypothetical protein [Nitrosococcus watsonii]ADJ29783.1 conserved hypothetical protein [Nitrosococcus watsonii C-113]
MKLRWLILAPMLFSTTSLGDMLEDRGMVQWDVDSRNYLECSEKNIFLRILCEPVEFVGNMGARWPINILEEGGFGAMDWGRTAGDKIPVLGHILGGAAGLGVGAFKGVGEGFIYSFPAVLEKPGIID